MVVSLGWRWWRWRSTAVTRVRVIGGEKGVFGAGGLEVGDEIPEGGGLVEVAD